MSFFISRAAAAAVAGRRCCRYTRGNSSPLSFRSNGVAAASFSSVSAAQAAPSQSSQHLNLNITTNSEPYDVFIIGGGVAGTALLYELAAFTNLNKVGLAERRHGFGLVQSHPKNNSQTIHCGDIETNYTIEKAKIVKRQADMLRNFATKLAPAVRDK
ncbi:malate:quinone oxidoreductase, putative [Eimeria acervulina]|uniref:Malate:quinone oxidoreductase, putative n=1 Tax=Eimeria acervulina TaxID=5801 RepID=U6GLW2_EIMAC|nr:malate:quinone oxidoreductase, putative [Eimeria acervulina]CDI80537.1 malate:quinone oxidoreductase, putative [Eimeria acervulina]